MGDRIARIRRAIKKSLILETNSRKHICETLRLIYDEIYDSPDKIFKEKVTELLVDAMVMAKKMQNRLLYYQNKYHDDTGDKGMDITRLPESVKRRQMRKVRII